MNGSRKTDEKWLAYVEGYKAGASCFIGDDDQLDEAATWSARNAGYYPDAECDCQMTHEDRTNLCWNCKEREGDPWCDACQQRYTIKQLAGMEPLE